MKNRVATRVILLLLLVLLLAIVDLSVGFLVAGSAAGRRDIAEMMIGYWQGHPHVCL